MSLILPDGELFELVRFNPCGCTGCREKKAHEIAQAQARHMAREIVAWIGREWDEQVYVDGNLRELEAWLRQEGVLE